MTEIKTEEEYVVAEYKGKYWGIEYEDGQCTCRGFVSIENAAKANPEFCKKPEDMTYKASHEVEKLRKAKLVKVKKTTIYQVSA